MNVYFVIFIKKYVFDRVENIKMNSLKEKIRSFSIIPLSPEAEPFMGWGGPRPIRKNYKINDRRSIL